MILLTDINSQFGSLITQSLDFNDTHGSTWTSDVRISKCTIFNLNSSFQSWYKRHSASRLCAVV